MKAPTFLGTVTDGKLTIKERSTFDLWVASLEGIVEVIVKPFKKTRSRAQRGYYFGVIVERLTAPLGLNSKEETNEWLKDEFNSKVITILGKEKVIGMSIEACKTDRVEEINRAIRQWASMELGIWLPEPNENEDYLLPQHL